MMMAQGSSNSHVVRNRVHELLHELSKKNPLRDDPTVPDFPKLTEPVCSRRAPVSVQLAAVQRAINQLTYNYLPTTFFSLQKNRPFYQIIATAKEIIEESLPIRCLEATFLALYLTCHLTEVDRIPVAFKSYSKGHFYRHIVLIVRYQSLFGALGLSRCPALMDKPIEYSTFVDLMEDYRLSYEAIGHQLVSFKLGLAAEHNAQSRRIPCWRFIHVPCKKIGTPFPQLDELRTILEKYTELYRRISHDYDQAVTPPKNLVQGKKIGRPLLDGGYEEEDDDDNEEQQSDGLSKASTPLLAITDGSESDCEDNRFRTSRLLLGVSPFSISTSGPSSTFGGGHQAAKRSRSMSGEPLRRAPTMPKAVPAPAERRFSKGLTPVVSEQPEKGTGDGEQLGDDPNGESVAPNPKVKNQSTSSFRSKSSSRAPLAKQDGTSAPVADPSKVRALLPPSRGAGASKPQDHHVSSRVPTPNGPSTKIIATLSSKDSPGNDLSEGILMYPAVEMDPPGDPKRRLVAPQSGSSTSRFAKEKHAVEVPSESLAPAEVIRTNMAQVKPLAPKRPVANPPAHLPPLVTSSSTESGAPHEKTNGPTTVVAVDQPEVRDPHGGKWAFRQVPQSHAQNALGVMLPSDAASRFAGAGQPTKLRLRLPQSSPARRLPRLDHGPPTLKDV
jgi:hypothetical protein